MGVWSMPSHGASKSDAKMWFSALLLLSWNSSWFYLELVFCIWSLMTQGCMCASRGNTHYMPVFCSLPLSLPIVLVMAYEHRIPVDSWHWRFQRDSKRAQVNCVILTTRGPVHELMHGWGATSSPQLGPIGARLAGGRGHGSWLLAPPLIGVGDQWGRGQPGRVATGSCLASPTPNQGGGGWSVARSAWGRGRGRLGELTGALIPSVGHCSAHHNDPPFRLFWLFPRFGLLSFIHIDINFYFSSDILNQNLYFIKPQIISTIFKKHCPIANEVEMT